MKHTHTHTEKDKQMLIHWKDLLNKLFACLIKEQSKSKNIQEHWKGNWTPNNEIHLKSDGKWVIALKNINGLKLFQEAVENLQIPTGKFEGS